MIAMEPGSDDRDPSPPAALHHPTRRTRCRTIARRPAHPGKERLVTGKFLHEHHDPAPQGGITRSLQHYLCHKNIQHTSETASFRRIGFETSGKTERRSAAESHLAQSSSASRLSSPRPDFSGRNGRRNLCALRSSPSLQFPCGIFVTLGKCFRPITLLGDFPVRMSQSEHAGACAWASRQFY